MFSLRQFKAGDFIDSTAYYEIIVNENNTIEEREIAADKFLVLLLRGKKLSLLDKLIRLFVKAKVKEQEVALLTEQYLEQLLEIKDSHEFAYSPPQSPSIQSQEVTPIANQYRTEFAETYGGYVELIYVVCTNFNYKPEEVYQLKTEFFLYWGNYLLHKKFVENIK